ncbi:expressed unknown protein [Seminavis robusta]|uniref:SCP domain-containing protein n=1 Tax=Seminavis robusta TaxID=568900 RepID=A0A9N8HX40_9STRA|nr:expressed unknown protein [Seminavis robusta]|eukprot:Sro2353_g324450.1 n/a (234) ;mRNA; r:3294-3995
MQTASSTASTIHRELMKRQTSVNHFFFGKKVLGVSFEKPTEDDEDVAQQPEWKMSGGLGFGKADDMPSLSDSSTASSTSNRRSSAVRTSALRRSSCTRSVTSHSQALDMVDADICSDHVLVNAERERLSACLRPLKRSEDLDELAREHAEAMAKELETFHSEASDTVSKLKETSFEVLGENVARGDSIEYIHMKMANRKPDFANMMNFRFTEMGMGTACGSDGKIYLCQLYRG